jgi:hypothetical protein
MKLNLQNSVSSPQDLKEIILDTRQYAKWFAQATIKKQVTNNTPNEPPALSEAAVTVITDWAKEAPLNQKRLDELITALDNLADTSPRITITLAAVPANSLKKMLVEWCRENITPNILVDIHFNSTLLGGMVVQYGSHVYDWSFRRQILAAREHFPEVLRRV